MGVFAYEALDAKGKPCKGVRESDSPKQLRQALRTEGLAPVKVYRTRDRQTSAKKKGESGIRRFHRQAKAAEVTLITRQLSTLVGAAIPLDECLQALTRQVQKPHLKAMLSEIRSKVLEGHSLADALGLYPKAFNSLYRAMVAAGEKSGHLDTVLDRLANYKDQQQQIHNKLVQAMIYPAILTVVVIAVVAALLATVVPTVIEQFDHMGQELPAMTRALIAMSDFVQAHGVKVLGGVSILALLRRQLLKKDSVRLSHDQWLLKIPVLGEVLCGVETARFSRTLSILTSSAVPLVEGMHIASGVLTNRYINRQLKNAAGRVKEGTALWAALDETQMFPPTMLHIIASGEKAGELETMLGRAADNQDFQFENQVNIALGVFGPLLIVIMAGMMLFIVLAILTPMLDLNSLVIS